MTDAPSTTSIDPGLDAPTPSCNDLPGRESWQVTPLSFEQFTALGSDTEMLTRAQLRHIAAFGLLAPTSHNTVPQRFRFDDDLGQMGLWLDRRYVLLYSDPVGRQATISCGCVLGYLAAAANAYGWEADATVVLDDPARTRPFGSGEPRLTEVARLSFRRRASEQLSDVLLGAMLSRKMVRAEYDPRACLTETDAFKLKQLAETPCGLRLHLITDTPTLIVLGKFQEMADSYVLNHAEFAAEFGEWLLPNDSPSPLGMRGVEFGLSDSATRHFHRGLLGSERLLPDEISGLAKSSNLAIRSSSAVAVITVDEDTVGQRLAAGQAYTEMALYLEQRGFCTAMQAGITEVQSANLALRGRLRTKARPTVVFRIGRPLRACDGDRPHSVRPALDEVILDG